MSDTPDLFERLSSVPMLPAPNEIDTVKLLTFVGGESVRKEDFDWVNAQIWPQVNRLELKRDLVSGYWRPIERQKDVTRYWNDERFDDLEWLKVAYQAGRKSAQKSSKSDGTHLYDWARAKPLVAELQSGFSIAAAIAGLTASGVFALSFSFSGAVTGSKALTFIGLFAGLIASVIYMWFETRTSDLKGVR